MTGATRPRAVTRAGTEATGPAPARVHFPGLETIRALAAVLVVVHHADALAGPARAGFLHRGAVVADGGVAVFFVLSGFLIYRPFVVAHLADRPGPAAVGFWWRRVLRIFPAYWVVLTFFWALGSYHLGRDWWRYYLLLQIYSKQTALGGVVQAWSLATEISFYVLVPVWAAALARLVGGPRGRRATAQLAGAGVLWVSAWVSRAAVERIAPSYRGLSFDWLPTNLDLFATGMALAVLSAWAAGDDRLRARLDRLARWAGPWWLAAVGLYVWYALAIGPAPDFATGYAGWFWHRRQLVLALISACLLVPAVFGPSATGALRRLWGWRPVVWVGTVSYGLYLWHFDWMKRSIANPGIFGGGWPGWVHTNPGDSNVWWLLAVGLGAGLLFAAVSWELLERPLQRHKRVLDRRPRR